MGSNPTGGTMKRKVALARAVMLAANRLNQFYAERGINRVYPEYWLREPYTMRSGYVIIRAEFRRIAHKVTDDGGPRKQGE